MRGAANTETLDNVPVPVQIALEPGLEENYDLEVNGPSHVPVSFQGPRSRIRELRELLQRGGGAGRGCRQRPAGT